MEGADFPNINRSAPTVILPAGCGRKNTTDERTAGTAATTGRAPTTDFDAEAAEEGRRDAEDCGDGGELRIFNAEVAEVAEDYVRSRNKQ
jgi:hypothetical protein